MAGLVDPTDNKLMTQSEFKESVELFVMGVLQDEYELPWKDPKTVGKVFPILPKLSWTKLYQDIDNMVTFTIPLNLSYECLCCSLLLPH